MNKKIVLRLKWYIKKEWIDKDQRDEITQSIDQLITYYLKSLLNQTSQDFLAFVQYPEAVETLLMDRLTTSQIVLPENIILTKETRAEIRNLFTEDYLKGYDQILFVRVNQKQIYHKDFVKELHVYNVLDGKRVILFKEQYQYCFRLGKLYETLEEEKDVFNYAYISRVDEYFKHLCVYDFFFPEVIERNYQKIPHEYYEKKVLLTLQENEKVVKNIDMFKFMEVEKTDGILQDFILGGDGNK